MQFANIILNRSCRFTIGDDIQLIAIENLYKHMGIDYKSVIRIDFYDLASYDGEYVILPISFPLYSYIKDTNIFSFSAKIIPVFLGLSTLGTVYSKEDIMYLKSYEPIGCRDSHTLKTIRKYNIQGYLSGCITMTLPKVNLNDLLKRNKVFCVDIPEELRKYIPCEILKNCTFVSHTYYGKELKCSEEEQMKEVYTSYLREARLIVTTRLHAAVPCLAAGLPVVFLKDHMSFRFSWVENLIHIYTSSEYNKIDWNPKPLAFEDIKESQLQVSAKRIWDTYHKYRSIYDLSAVFEKKDIRNYYVEFIDNTIEFINSTINRDLEFEYCLWGVTQTAMEINMFLKDNYAKSKMVGIIDRKDCVFEGMTTVRKEWLKENLDAFCFVCTGAAIKESKDYFSEIGKKNYFQCCEDGIK